MKRTPAAVWAATRPFTNPTARMDYPECTPVLSAASRIAESPGTTHSEDDPASAAFMAAVSREEASMVEATPAEAGDNNLRRFSYGANYDENDSRAVYHLRRFS